MQKQSYSLENTRLITKVALISLFLVVSFGISGCKTERVGNNYVTTLTIKPVDIAKRNLKAPKELDLPISGNVYIDISNQDITFKGHMCPRYPVGRFVRTAAVDVFQKGFTNVFDISNSSENDLAHLVVRTKGEVKMNCNWNYYSIKISSRVYKADGSLIGEYTKSDKGSTLAMDISNTNMKLQNNFAKIYINILSQFLSDAKLVALHREGYFGLPPVMVEF